MSKYLDRVQASLVIIFNAKNDKFQKLYKYKVR